VSALFVLVLFVLALFARGTDLHFAKAVLRSANRRRRGESAA
jgi:hypothetical protein